MVLFYNRTLFSKHGIVNPPAYWDEIVTIAPTLTIRQNGTFAESAIALGTPGTAYAKDIIMSIIAQLGQSPVVSVPGQLGASFYTVLANEPVTEGSEVLPLSTAMRYFTQFGDPGQNAFTWSDSLGEASDFFVGEKLAMYIGYSGELQSLRSRNPRAEIEMTFLPQTRGYNTFSTGMRMYAIGTLKSTKNPQAALTAASQFAGGGVSPSIAAIVGGVPSLRAYAGTSGLDPVVARSMLVARGWLDLYADQSNAYVQSMISDIIDYRYGVSDAASMFVSRLKDLYAKK
jgi:ABC-type glycerol-3-phosphate transport system substrate-binding protein